MRYALACMLAFAGCAGRTEILLTISAGGGLTYGSGQEIDTLVIEAQPAANPPTTGNWYYSALIALCPDADSGTANCRPQPFADPSYKGALTLPVMLLLVPGESNFDSDVRVWINGLKNGSEQIAAGDRFPFAKGRRTYVDIPLFKQCIGNLTCQPIDEACAADTNCVAIPPTPTPTPSGTDGSPLADMTMLGDMSVACGAAEQNCCNGACDNGYTCGSTGICFSSTGPSCGQNGQSCCLGDQEGCVTGSICSSGVCAKSCAGGSGAECVAGQVCSTEGVCIVCGGEGQTCCANSVCTNSTVDYCNGTDCVACGGPRQHCCSGSTCANPNSYQCGPSTTCDACGGVGDSCCGSGQTCLNTPDGGMQATCSGTVCTICDGHEMGPCCPGGAASSPAQQHNHTPLGPIIDVPLNHTPSSPLQPDDAC